MPNGAITLYTARHVFPVSGPPISNGAVTVTDGRIVAVGTAAGLRERYHGAHMVDLGERALLPGLVNAHTHLELTHHAGHVADNLPLIEWIYPLVSYSRTRTLEDFERAAYAGVEMLRACGTVAVGEICTFGQSVRPLVESGLHGIVYYELLSPDPARADELMRQGQQQIEHWNQAVAAFEGKSLLSHVARVQVFLEGFRGGEPLKNMALLVGGIARLGASAFEPLLNPLSLCRIGDVHVFRTDGAAVSFAQSPDDLPQRHLLGPDQVA